MWTNKRINDLRKAGLTDNDIGTLLEIEIYKLNGE